MTLDIDVRGILPAIRVPTLILHRSGDRRIDVGGSRYMAQAVANAKFVELPGDDHLVWDGDSDTIVEEVEHFLTGARHAAEPPRGLATVMFTDIVEYTSRASQLAH